MIASLGGRPGAAGRTLVVASLGAAGLLAATGCSNPFSPEGTDPGVYKGAPDALFGASAGEREAALRDRLELIQNR